MHLMSALHFVFSFVLGLHSLATVLLERHNNGSRQHNTNAVDGMPAALNELDVMSQIDQKVAGEESTATRGTGLMSSTCTGNAQLSSRFHVINVHTTKS